MHDVQGHLAVVDARDVHAPNPLRADDLGRELGRLAQDDHPPLAEGERQALGPAGGRDRLAVVAVGRTPCRRA